MGARRVKLLCFKTCDETNKIIQSDRVFVLRGNLMKAYKLQVIRGLSDYSDDPEYGYCYLMYTLSVFIHTHDLKSLHHWIGSGWQLDNSYALQIRITFKWLTVLGSTIFSNHFWNIKSGLYL